MSQGAPRELWVAITPMGITALPSETAEAATAYVLAEQEAADGLHGAGPWSVAHYELVSQTRPHLPLSALWLDAEGVGIMIGCPDRQVRERIALRPDFPKAARIRGTGGIGAPRWNAAEVDSWMRRQRDGGRQRKG
jgi:predicted DNA-binding transcriptional regulator AlpA